MLSFIPDTDNSMFQLAIQLVNQSNRTLFLTGKAGTGKTTFLKYIRKNCLKQMAVVAPTGVAAINAGGVTIHSFFQLPFEPFIPEPTSRHQLISRLRLNSEKKKLLQELELLIIDEISMVRCDVLDAIDLLLKHVRQRSSERFGGVQVLFIGDLLQLPPVIKPDEWQLLNGFYNSPFFFDSLVLQEDPPLYIEFNKIYRQSEEQFIRLLNQVRNNELDEEGKQILESRFQPGFRRNKEDGYIVLTTHNHKAAAINNHALQEIDTTLYSYDAEIQDDFPDRSYPADDLLLLKTGAQVMFIKNDAAENGKRYFNGKIGIITRLEAEKVYVRCEGEDVDIEVQKETWENIRYSLDKTTRKIESVVLGSFRQFPLRLAWAITIHKSQGLTFEKAIIDAGEAFAPGQVYVALSRCTSLSGMVLQSRINAGSLFTDNRILHFSKQTASGNQLAEALAQSRISYQQALLKNCFDLAIPLRTAHELMEYLQEHSASFNEATRPWLAELTENLNNLQDVARKFHQQLAQLFLQSEEPETNLVLQERIVAATTYFINTFSPLLHAVSKVPAITDSRLHAKEFNDSVREIFAQLAEKKFLMEGYSQPFSIEAFQLRRQKFVLPPFSVNAYAGATDQRIESPHPVLHQQLRKLRESICAKKNLPVYIVAGTKTIDEMARYLPQSLQELTSVSGFGSVKIEQYGQQFLDIILAYTKEYNLESSVHEIEKGKKRKQSSTSRAGKQDSKSVSFSMFKDGKNMAEIAHERNLTIQTIEGHLAYYVETGSLHINTLLEPEKLSKISSAIKDYTGGSITQIKQQLGPDISYGEIKLALAWVTAQQHSSADE